MKFHIDEKWDLRVCEKGVEEKLITVPSNITDTTFCEFFKKNVKQALAILMHNSQTLARKNWIGKNNISTNSATKNHTI